MTGEVPDTVLAALLVDDCSALAVLVSDPFIRAQALRATCILGAPACCQFLAESATQVLQEDNQSFTPLHHAAQGGHSQILHNFLSISGVRAGINQRTTDVRLSRLQYLCGGVTPLHLACASGDETSVKLLLEHKADPSAEDNNGWSCAEHGQGSVAVLQVLNSTPRLSCLNVNMYMEAARRRAEKVVTGLTPSAFSGLVTQADSGNAQPLRSFLRCADTKNLRIEGSSAVVATIVLGSPAGLDLVLNALRYQSKPGHDQQQGLPCLNDLDSIGLSPVHSAIELGSLDCLQVLLKANADVNQCTQDASYQLGQTCTIYLEGGRTPLHMAVRKLSPMCVELLLEFSADPDAQDTFLQTPRETVWEMLVLCSESQKSRAEAIAQSLGVTARTSQTPTFIMAINTRKEAELRKRIQQAAAKKVAEEDACILQSMQSYEPLDAELMLASNQAFRKGQNVVLWQESQTSSNNCDDFKFSRSLTITGTRSSGVESSFGGVFVFDLLSADLCKRIWMETENYVEQAKKHDWSMPVRHDGGIDVARVFPKLVAMVVEAAMPAIVSLMSSAVHKIKLRHAFRTFNYVGREEEFKRHQDKYAVTLNICLHKTADVLGSGVYFFDSEADCIQKYRHEHQVGVAILHSSKEWHQTEQIGRGERGSMIMWFEQIL